MKARLGVPPSVDRKSLLELKARLPDPSRARRWAKANAQPQGIFRQVDTYFRVPSGRLKLRKTEGREEGTLIFYLREDVSSDKRSEVHLLAVDHPQALRQVLAEALGVLVIVEKRRAIYRWGEVQIHLDQVEGLGPFLEFERVLATPDEDAAARAEFEELKEALGVRVEDMVAGSYSDLLHAKEP